MAKCRHVKERLRNFLSGTAVTIFLLSAANALADEAPQQPTETVAPCDSQTAAPTADIETIQIAAVEPETAPLPETAPSQETGQLQSVATTNAPPPDQSPTVRVVLNELLPDPVGKDADGEFIELANISATTTNLADWSLIDDRGKKYVLPPINLAGGGFVSLPYSQTKITLTNDGTSISLLAPTGEKKDDVAYAPPIKEGRAYARNDDGSWSWTAQPTPGAMNEFPSPVQAAAAAVQTAPSLPAVQVPSTQTATTGSIAPLDAPMPAPPVENPPVTPSPAAEPQNAISADDETVIQPSLDELTDMDDDTTVLIEGIVSLPPGKIGKSIFALQDAPGTAGTFVRVFGKSITGLNIGDQVKMKGTIKKSDGRFFIATSARNVTKQIAVGRITYDRRELAELDATDAGVSIATSGIVTNHGRNWLTIADAEAKNTARVSLPTGNVGPVENGATATVKGVVRPVKNGLEIIAASRKNIAFDSLPPIDPAAPPPAAIAESAADNVARDPIIISDHDGKQLYVTVGFAAIAAISIAGIAGFALWRRRKLIISDGV